MKLSDLPECVQTFGDPEWRGNCPPEHVEQASFFARLRREYPDTFGALAFHPRNEGLKRHGQLARHAVAKHEIEGMTRGAADIIIPARVAFVCELKRQDRTKSKWEDGQLAYLEAAAKCGAFACVAFGAVAAWEAFEQWRAMNDR
jgi:hypothetical protein